MDDKTGLLPEDGSSDPPPEYTQQPAYQPPNQPVYQPAVEYDQLLGQSQFNQPGFQSGQYLNIHQASLAYDQPVAGFNQPARGQGRPATGYMRESAPQESTHPPVNSAETPSSRPEDHWCLAVFTLVFTLVFGCWCFGFGIAAVCFASKSRRAWREDRRQEAAQYSRDAFTVSVVGIFLAIIVIVFTAWRVAVHYVCSDPDHSDSLLC